MRQFIPHALLATALLLSVPGPAAAANKEHEAIQRDIAMLGEELRRLQSSLNNEFTAMRTMVQQAINGSDKAQNSVLVLETRMTERMQSLEKSLALTVATLNSKVDTMADEFRAIKEESKEANARLLRLNTKLDDMKTLIQLLPEQMRQQAPAPPVPGVGPQAEGSQPPPGGTTPIVPTAVNGAKLFEDAERDRLAGKNDLAIREYREFVKQYPRTERSCEAQFRVGELLLKKDDIVHAAAEFDMVLEGLRFYLHVSAGRALPERQSFRKSGPTDRSQGRIPAAR